MGKIRLRSVLLFTFLLGATSVNLGCDGNEELDLDRFNAGVTKANGGTSGVDGDYCNSNDCVTGEADCDIDAHCGGEPGLACGTDNGPFWTNGGGVGWDVCVPAVCANGTRDIASGEIALDCGGPCADDDNKCNDICGGRPAVGSTGYCSESCVCNSGEGDCTSDAQCAIEDLAQPNGSRTALVCATGYGPQFGYSSGKNVCVKASCTNGTREDANGETWIDCGGDCGATCVCDRGIAIGTDLYCNSTCRCRARRGDCDSDGECEPSHTCTAGIGPRFGFASGIDVCLANHCTNGTQDGDETGVDCGPSCLNCPGELLQGAATGGANEDLVQDIAIDTTGNMVIAGRFTGTPDFGGGAVTNQGGTDVFVVKYDQSGTFVWARTFGSATSDGDYSLDVAVGPGGDVVVVGNFYTTVSNYGLGAVVSAGGADVFAVGLDGATGATQWQQTFGSTGRDLGRGVAFGPTGALYMIGAYEGTVTFGPSTLTSNGDEDIFVAQLTPTTGVPVRARGYGGTAKDIGTSITTNSTSVYVAGHFLGEIDFGGGTTLTSTGTSDVFVARLSSTLAIQTVGRFGGFSSDTVNGIGVDDAGNVAVGGTYSQTVQFGTFTSTVNGGTDAWVASLDSALNVRWLSTFGSTGSDEVLSVAVEPSTGRIAAGGYLAGSAADFPGGASTGLGSTDAFLVVYGSNGTVLSSATGGGTGADRATDVNASSTFLGYTGWYNGSVTITGDSNTSTGQRDVFFQRLGI